MTDASTNPRHNHLLVALPQDQWQRWLPSLATFGVRLRNALIQRTILFGVKGGSDGAFAAIPTSTVSAADIR
jgi:hypothetical protein